MGAFSKFLFRLRTTFGKRQLDAEMAEEMREHLELRIERNVAAGMSPEEARYAAQRSFGGVEQLKERCRDERGARWIHDLVADVRYAIRQLRKTPGIAAVAVLSLAIGIGANTAIFSLVDEEFLQSLPVENPDELILFEWLPGIQGGRPHRSGGNVGAPDIDVASGQEASAVFSLEIFEAFRGQSSSLAEVFAMAPLWGLNVNVEHQAENRNGQFVSGNYYAALGARALLGRTLQPADDQPGAPAAAVISERYWRTRFAADPAVMGKTIQVNRTSVTIVGVTPGEFRGALLSAGSPEITLPLALASQVSGKIETGYWWLYVMGRLKPGVAAIQVRDGLVGTFRASARDSVTNPNDFPRLAVTSASHGRTAAARAQNLKWLLPLMGMAGLLLVVACANVANLLLAQGAVRRREIAMRLALGASRSRLIRQLLTESMVLALLGVGLGVFFSRWGLDLMATTFAMADPDHEMFERLGLNGTVLAFAVVAGLVTGAAFGLAPALRATRLDLTTEFQSGARHPSGVRSRLSQGLMVAQVALSLVLLIVAGLFVRTLRNVQNIEIGFNREHLLLFSVDGRSLGYRDTQLSALHQAITEKIVVLPGVRAVTYSSWPLVSGYGGEFSRFTIPGQSVPPGRNEDAGIGRVGANFFETYGMPILSGRGFTPHDGASAPKVGIVNEALVKKFFGGENPLGRQIRVQAVMEIVGVVRDVKQNDLRALTPPTVFVPSSQSTQGQAHFAVRTVSDPVALVAEIRRAVADVDESIPVVNVRTQAEQIAWRLTGERLFANLSVFIGLVALGLACLGLFGLMSYLVVRRTAEIGVRMALGAQPRRVQWMILRESLAMVGIGVLVGLGTAYFATRLISAMLFGLSPVDPATYVVVALLLIVVAAIACLLPARRAARVDPVVALRCE